MSVITERRLVDLAEDALAVHRHWSEHAETSDHRIVVAVAAELLSACVRNDPPVAADYARRLADLLSEDEAT